jgi:hypothetical protein
VEIISRLKKQMYVYDYRPGAELYGDAARYPVSDAKWPEIDSASYLEMVASNRVRITKQIEEMRAFSSNRPNVKLPK